MLNKADEQRHDHNNEDGPPTVTGSARQQLDEDAVIGRGLKITGNLDCDGDIVIAGSVEGDVVSRGLTIVKDATVNGTIRSETVRVIGNVEGKINARSVRIAKTALVSGDISYDSLGVEDGATINGQLRREDF